MRTILEGKEFKGTSIVRYNDRWWLYTTINGHLHLYHTDDVVNGKWEEHPLSPLKKQVLSGRRMSGGRPVVHGGKVIRCVPVCVCLCVCVCVHACVRMWLCVCMCVYVM